MHTDDRELREAEAKLRDSSNTVPAGVILETLNEVEKELLQGKAYPPNYVNGVQDALRAAVKALAQEGKTS